MTTLTRWLVASAAVIAILFGGFVLWRGPAAPASSPSPTASPTAAVPSGSPSDGPLDFHGPAVLEPGTYRSDRFIVPVTLDVPPGWTNLDDRLGEIELVRTEDGKPFGTVPNTALLGLYAIDGVFADPCRDAKPISPAPATVDDVVRALTNQAGYEAGPVTSVEIDGAPARRFDLVARIPGQKCANDPPNQWTYASTPGQVSNIANNSVSEVQERLWVVDLAQDAQRPHRIILIDAQVDPDLAQDLPETQRIVESIRWK